MANDQTVYGASTYGAGKYSPYTVSVSSAKDTETVGTPTLTQTLTASPSPISDPDVVGTPWLAPSTMGPASTTDPDQVGSPAVATASTLVPASVIDPDPVGAPTAGFTAQLAPAGTTDTGIVGAPGVSFVGSGYGDGAYGNGTYGGRSNLILPATTGDTDRVGTPALSGAMAPSTGTYGSGTYNSGAYTGTPAVTPAGITDPDTVGTPTLPGATGPTNGTYGSGTYGAGVYPGTATVTPGAITDPDTIGAPTAGGAGSGSGGSTIPTPGGYGSGTYGGGAYTGTPSTPTDPGTTPTTGGYGSGTYGAGTYTGTPGAPSTGGYGAGPYGAGIYPGTAKPTDGSTPGTINWPATPLYGAPLHLLGIGPWNPTKAWRGALNYGIGKGVSPARPHMQLPGVQSKQFTLRLDGGNEATASLVFARGDAVIVDEMATDLWWRRKDPRTGVLETIGRFNTSHNDLSRGDDGSVASSLQFQDYAILLGNRMILKYKDMKNGESFWPINTPITEIMRFFVPADMGIDISILDDPDVLGKTLIPFEDLPPSNTIADTFTALKAISSVPDWEWWVDTPDDMTLPPKLAFAPKRGRDRGVVLVDIGQGSSPIASWSMRATSDTYANAIYFQGKDGAVITSIPAEITANGQRDVQDSNNSVPGTIGADKLPDLLIAAARKKLVTLADRRPTFTIVLAPGFWRGRHHIDVGDTVRIFIKLGHETLDYSYRVTEIGVDIDQADTETVTLTLGNPLASANPRSRYSPITKVVRLMKTYEAPAGSDVTVDEANLNPTPTTVNMP